MANIIDYLNWRGDLDFRQAPFNAVDSIILSRLSYLPFEGIVPPPSERKTITVSEAVKRFSELTADGENSLSARVSRPEDSALLKALGESRRFRDFRLAGFVNHVDASQEKQFAALTILMKKGPVFVSYRGTDNTIVGWKEDLNMAFLDHIPSQQDAAEYLNNAAQKFKGKLMTGGHSKGGNLAVYAAAFCGRHVQNRITGIFNNDGPGFREEIVTGKEYRKVVGRIQTFVPQGSVVGMLFEHGDNYTVVSSTKKGLLQHDLYSWEVTPNDVLRLHTVTSGSAFMDKTMNEWISGLNNEQRRQFADTLYQVLSSTEAQTVPELSTSWLKSSLSIVHSLGSIDKETRDAVVHAVSALVKSARNNMGTLFPRSRKKTWNSNPYNPTGRLFVFGLDVRIEIRVFPAVSDTKINLILVDNIVWFHSTVCSEIAVIKRSKSIQENCPAPAYRQFKSDQGGDSDIHIIPPVGILEKYMQTGRQVKTDILPHVQLKIHAGKKVNSISDNIFCNLRYLIESKGKRVINRKPDYTVKGLHVYSFYSEISPWHKINKNKIAPVFFSNDSCYPSGGYTFIKYNERFFIYSGCCFFVGGSIVRRVRRRDSIIYIRNRSFFII
ncbi:DUF2974 domain-containing protein [Brucepastera parasyntrophica]|uniref:DUF2974 domain-containing protein n=1 Tax=Brucepastera parasyntrophica TaxID=2880008 RepID=UPI00210987B2|nr:DUF2974 domain-containing protein [Brucepastera parasyntrophica]ULQ60319.1 DUF2974 domain-containing protein [Brucepastera parasyntrophica]